MFQNSTVEFLAPGRHLLSDSALKIELQGNASRNMAVWSDNVSLEERFFEFARSFPGAESIDNMELSKKADSAKRADFFFENRRIICECKCLKKDIQDKVKEVLSPYRFSPYWPEHFEEIGLADLANRFPEAEAKIIKKKATEALISTVEPQVKTANRQIKGTKGLFNLKSAGGFLVLLNDGVNMLSPEFITHGVGHTFRKRTPEGQCRYTEIVCALVITNTHYFVLNDGEVVRPLVSITNTEADKKLGFVAEFAESLLKSWAKFWGVDYLYPGENFSWDRYPSKPFQKVAVTIDGFPRSSSLILVPRRIRLRRKR